MNRYELSWVDTALAQDEVIRELRAELREVHAMFSGFVLAICRNHELYDMARLELSERYPEERPA